MIELSILQATPHDLDQLFRPGSGCHGTRRSFRRMEFVLNRFPFACQHRALAMLTASEMKERLFPTAAPPEKVVRLPRDFQLFDKKLGQNEEQLQAV